MTHPSWYQITVSRDKYTDSAESLGKWFDEHGARDWAIGNETGLDGYRHFQIVVHFKKGVPEKTMIESFKAVGHVTPSHVHNFDYAMKTGDYITSWKDPLASFRNANLRSWQAEAVGLIEYQNDREILCIVDMVGGKGKTFLAKWLEANGILDVCPVISEEYNDYTGYCLKFPKPGYMFDIPRCVSTKRRMTMWAGIETIKNGLLFEKRYSPEKRWIDPPKILITTNQWPPVEALSHDRWQIYKLVQDSYGDQLLGEARLIRVPWDEVPHEV